MKVNNDMNNLYAQNAWNTANVGRVSAAAKVQAAGDKTAEAVKDSTSKVETDRPEFSQDTKVTQKMTDSERAALVKSLKEDMDNQMTRFTNMMVQMFQKQGITGMTAQNEDFWKTIASGNYVVDAATKAEAQQAISEDGYWGVKQTSQRIFDFAKAIAGDDEKMMRKMQNAVEKGFKEAGKAWGREMPSITSETHNAVNELFNGYYAKTNKTEE